MTVGRRSKIKNKVSNMSSFNLCEAYLFCHCVWEDDFQLPNQPKHAKYINYNYMF